MQDILSGISGVAASYKAVLDAPSRHEKPASELGEEGTEPDMDMPDSPPPSPASRASSCYVEFSEDDGVRIGCGRKS